MPVAIWVMQPMLPVAMTSGDTLSMLATLRVFELTRNLRLHDVVDARRSTAQMSFGYITHGKACLRQKRLRLGLDLLTMLHGTGGVIGDSEVTRRFGAVDAVAQQEIR